MRTMITDMNKWQMYCCCYSIHMMSRDKKVKTDIINIHKKRQKYEENSIYSSIDYRAAA